MSTPFRPLQNKMPSVAEKIAEEIKAKQKGHWPLPDVEGPPSKEEIQAELLLLQRRYRYFQFKETSHANCSNF